MNKRLADTPSQREGTNGHRPSLFIQEVETAPVTASHHILIILSKLNTADHTGRWQGWSNSNCHLLLAGSKNQKVLKIHQFHPWVTAQQISSLVPYKNLSMNMDPSTLQRIKMGHTLKILCRANGNGPAKNIGIYSNEYDEGNKPETHTLIECLKNSKE